MIGLHLHPVWLSISISIKDKFIPSLIYMICVATSLYNIPFLLWITVFEIELFIIFFTIGFSADYYSFFYFSSISFLLLCKHGISSVFTCFFSFFFSFFGFYGTSSFPVMYFFFPYFLGISFNSSKLSSNSFTLLL